MKGTAVIADLIPQPKNHVHFCSVDQYMPIMAEAMMDTFDGPQRIAKKARMD